MKKLSMLVLVLIMSLVLVACHEETTTTTTYAPLDCEYGYHQELDACVKDEDLSTLGQILGLEDITVPVGHYFDVFEGVQVLSSEMEDITYLLSVRGNVQYGVEGTYGLSYTLIYQNETYSMNRAVTVADVADTPSTQTRPSVTSGTVSLGEGSYVTGTDTSIAHPTTPTYLEKDLLVDAIPSSSWWTSLLVQNWGGSNGIYTNPLRLAFASGGMEITDPGDGFVQFWNVNNVQTIAQFPIALRDGYLMSSSLSSSYSTQVLSYGDSHVKVALRNPSSTIDEMVVTMAQGSPYVFVETAHPNLTYTFDTAGVDNYRYYDLEGNQVTDTYTGEALIVEMVHRHSGYECTPPANIGAAQYEDKYYLINTPANTVFTISSYNHPFGLDNRVSIALGDRNTLSIASIQDLSEAAYYHEHGYHFIDMTHISYEIDAVASNVTTTYHYSFREVPGGTYGVMVLMPHQYKYSDVELTDYSYRTVRGTLKVFEGDTFQTVLNFRGLLPGFTLPTDDSFSLDDTVGYLNNLNTSMSLTDMDGYINAEGPYWNSKAIYPLAQAIIISRQLGETTLESDFVSKMEYVLLDWLSVSGPADEKYLYYDNTWGSVYYSNNDFNTAAELSDHSFTHGYLVYAAAVLAMADPNFVTQYGDMVDFLLNDYLYPERGNAQFAYLRNFDPWAGHSWAHGFGTFAEGNNLESSSEALNSWNAGYLWAMVTGDTARMEAAIYGYVTELSAAKEYWFDYDDTNWDPVYGDVVDVAGMVWGGKFDYATWFGANPTFIYGIQWIPTGEYLTSYALTSVEKAKLASIFQTYLDAKNGVIDTWYSNMWAIEAIVDPISAIQDFEATKILSDDYPFELVGSYWMVHAMASLGSRTSDVWMGIHPNVASTIYEKDGNIVAMIWNPTHETQTVRFYNASGLLQTETIEAHSFVSRNIES